MRIYVASSWRNLVQATVVDRLRDAGHDVYDFREPAPGNNGFHWSQIDVHWQTWTPDEFKEALDHPIAVEGFDFDFNALRNADGIVLVLPAGRSAHLEFGFGVAMHLEHRIIFMPEPVEPELMYRMANEIVTKLDDLVEALGGVS